MTSAYNEATLEREQKAKFCIAGIVQKLNNPETLIDMEESTSSRASLAMGDSSSDESFPISSVEVSVSTDKSFDGDISSAHEEERKTTDGREDDIKDEESFNCSTLSETSDNSWRNRFRSKESFENDERRGETKGSFTILTANSTAPEIAIICGPRKGQVKDQKNQSGLEICVQERRATYDDGVNAGNDVHDSAGDVLLCCKNLAEFRLDEMQHETEKEISLDRQDDRFYDAVRSGNAKRVSALIASGCVSNLDEPDWNVSGDPPLLVAATNHCLPVLSALLTNGCDPAVRSPRGETALHRAILNGGPGNVLKFVEHLLKHGCPANVKEAGSGSTALHVLSRQLAHTSLRSPHHNFDAALKTLELLARAGPVNAKDHHGRSALHILASSTIFDNNHKTDIESLIGTVLAAGADTALKNDRGETPLHESLECGTLNTAMLLVQHTPTGITSRYGETPLHIASRKNHIDMVMKLLDHGEDPSMQDASGNTPLHLASARGFHQTVSLLVTSPLAQLENINIEGLTALQVAAESGFVNAAKILLRAGADSSQTINYLTTTLRRRLISLQSQVD